MKKEAVKIKTEIKFLKISYSQGIAEYKVNQPRVNNGCVLSFMSLQMLKELKKLLNNKIKIRTAEIKTKEAR